MTAVAARFEPRAVGPTLVVGGVAVVAAWLAARSPLEVPFLMVGGLALAAVAFLRTEWAIHLLILSMLLSPEFAVGGPVGAGSLDTTRSAVIRLDDLLLLVIGAAWLAKLSVHKRLGVVLRTPLNAPIALYATLLGLSTLLGVAAGRVQPLPGGLYLAKYLEYFVVYFLVVNHVRSRRVLMRMIVTAMVTAVLVALIAATQIPGGERVSAPFEGARGEPNTLGGYLVLMMAVMGGIALETGEPRRRWVLVAGIGVLALPLIYTLSRSSWLAAAVAALVLLGLTPRKRALAAVLAGVALVLLLFAPAAVAERLSYTFTQHPASVEVAGVSLDASTSDRLRSWGQTVGDSMRRPVFGHGVTGYHFIDAQYFRLLAEVGLAGFAAFCVLIVLLARCSFAGARRLRTPALRGMAAGFLAALAGLLVHGLGANTFIIVRIMEPFWLFAGLVMAAPFVERDDVTG